MKLKKVTQISGSYDGISFQIKNWKDYEGEDRWTYYLFLVIEAIPDESRPKSFVLRKKYSELGGKRRSYYNYYDHPIIGNIDFHGGCTWYSKEAENKIIKVGCDYSHLWDEDKCYTIDDIVSDVKKSIQSFRELVPNYKYRCITIGGYWDKSDGIFIKQNSGEVEFTSNKGLDWREKQNGWERIHPSWTIVNSLGEEEQDDSQ